MSVTRQVYIPSSPASVGLTRRLLLGRNVNFDDDGLITDPSFNHEMETDTVEEMLQLKRAGLPLVTIMSLGATSNATVKRETRKSY